MSTSQKNKLLEQIDYFKKVSLFNGLSDQQIKTLIDIMHPEHFEADSFIMREKDSGDKFYVLIKGEVEISKSLILPQWVQATQKSEKALIRLSEKQYPFFGEMSMFDDNAKREASIKAIVSCEMVSLDKSGLDKILKKNPETGRIVYRNIAGELVKRLRKANQDILKLTTAFTLALEG
jgi:CRP/FNR family cyclic AMP-dependent transcriptional regulator